MRKADAILEQFPGPVTLRVSRTRLLIGLALMLGFAAFCTWLVFAGDARARTGWYDSIMAPVAAVVFAALAIRALILLVMPSVSGLTLDAAGFRIGRVFKPVRHLWREVGGFRVAVSQTHGNTRQILYDVLAPRDARGARNTGTLPDQYGLPQVDLAWLMQEWRGRALAQPVQPLGRSPRSGWRAFRR